MTIVNGRKFVAVTTISMGCTGSDWVPTGDGRWGWPEQSALAFAADAMSAAGRSEYDPKYISWIHRAGVEF